MLYALIGGLLIALAVGVMNDTHSVRQRVQFAVTVFLAIAGFVFLITAFDNAMSTEGTKCDAKHATN